MMAATQTIRELYIHDLWPHQPIALHPLPPRSEQWHLLYLSAPAHHNSCEWLLLCQIPAALGVENHLSMHLGYDLSSMYGLLGLSHALCARVEACGTHAGFPTPCDRLRGGLGPFDGQTRYLYAGAGADIDEAGDLFVEQIKGGDLILQKNKSYMQKKVLCVRDKYAYGGSCKGRTVKMNPELV